MTTAPWRRGRTAASAVSEPAISVASEAPHHGAVTGPQPGVPAPDLADQLPRWSPAWSATIWWVGVHGGAGESSLTTLAAGSQPARHAWPIPALPGTFNRVALVARTSWTGLTAAQHAATEWASGSLGAGLELAGLVLIADAPGRLPKPLQDLQAVIAGGVPRVWSLPWVEAWRLGPPTIQGQGARSFRDLLNDLDLTPSDSAQN